MMQLDLNFYTVGTVVKRGEREWPREGTLFFVKGWWGDILSFLISEDHEKMKNKYDGTSGAGLLVRYFCLFP